MELGAFSVSLAVKDLAASLDFYTKLGFQRFGGNPEENWVILKNGVCVLGLFQGMFERNLLTFSPGWNQNAETMPDFTDIRTIQAALKEAGLTLTSETDPQGRGPASFTLEDPDGNPILFDQYVPA